MFIEKRERGGGEQFDTGYGRTDGAGREKTYSGWDTRLGFFDVFSCLWISLDGKVSPLGLGLR